MYEKQISRRSFLEHIAKDAAFAGGTLLLGGSGIYTYVQINARRNEPAGLATFPVPTQPETPAILSVDAIIANEISKRDIHVSPSEQSLWQQGYQTPKTPIPLTESNRQITQMRLNQTLELMQISENEYLKDAANYLIPLLAAKECFLEPTQDPYTDRFGGAVTNIYKGDNGLQVRIRYANSTVLNNYNQLLLAINIAHEIEHARNIRNFDTTLSTDLTVDQRLQKHQDRLNDVSNRIQEESRGNGIQMQAYITARGLVGEELLKGAKEDLIPQRAAAFISCGNNIESQCWQQFVKTQILYIR